MNMSYCRFENTYGDLKDCYEHLNDTEEEMTSYEKIAKKHLINLCKTIALETSNKD